MGPVRILILVVALAAALGAVVIVRGMSKAQPTTVAAAPTVVEKPVAQVLVAKRDLPAGTKLVEADMTWQAWPQDSLNAAFILQKPADTKGQAEAVKAAVAVTEQAKKVVGAPDDALLALVGAVVREPVLANEPMTERKVVRAGTAGIMAVSLEPGMRAMAVPLSAESAAGGFILPGDHVDVVQSREVEGATGKRFVAGTVLKNVRVLAIDQTTTATNGTAVVGATATLELSSAQAEVLTLAKVQGALTLVLRSYADSSGPAVTVAQNNDSDPADLAFNASVVREFRAGALREVPLTQ